MTNLQAQADPAGGAVADSEVATYGVYRDGEIHTLVTGSVEDAYFVRSECANDFPGSEWTLGEVRA